ncbi:MAG TPA: geranylgeranyl reductase family protein [Candidatus Binatia bacterium]|nr:geranylgeranyl reductase family protein [Candidatus Binatia bacterium]
MKHFDVAIIGAGPAGSSAAIQLATKGYSVALLDKEQFPREKLCGDFLNPVNWPLLRELKVERAVLARPHEKVSIFRFTSFSGEEAEIPLPAGRDGTVVGLGLRRFDLDHVLLERANSLGVTVLDGWKPKELERQPDGWMLKADKSLLGARVLIGADGRNSWVAHHLGLADPAAMQGRSVGFQFRLKCANRSTGKIEIHLFPGGYAGVVGLAGDTVTLGLAIEKHRLLDGRPEQSLLESILPQNPWLKEILRSGSVSEMRSTYPVYFPPRRAYGDGVLLVGDAARVNEPVTGEGIYFALKSGVFAAKTVDEGFQMSDFSLARLRSYERNCRSAFRARRAINALIRWLIYRPALLSRVIRLSHKRTRLLDPIVQMICAPQLLDNPSSLSPRGRG